MNRLRSIVTVGFVLLAFSLDMSLGLLRAADAAPVPSAGTTAPSVVAN